MEIRKTTTPAGAVEIAVTGRLDSYWADHLDSAIAETMREGHDRIRVDLAGAIFLSSAGLAVLMKFYKQLHRINGSLVVINPSEPARLVLEMTRMAPILVEGLGGAQAAAKPAVPLRQGRQIERAGARLEVFDVAPGAALTCRSVGTPPADGMAGISESAGVTLSCPESMFAVGVGAFGDTLEDCRGRFGELLAVSGAVIYQPGDGTNVPDYLIASDGRAPEARLLYGLACDGRFATLTRFEATGDRGAIPLSELAEASLDVTGADAAGVVIVGEAAGLVGAALRASPAGTGDFFAHPAVRSRLTFTSERAFGRTQALIVGVVAKRPQDSQLRPLRRDGGLVGHFHAAAFPFRPLRKGELHMKETIATLFEGESVLGVLHLLNDDREAVGAGESELIRGAFWASPCSF